MPEYSSAVRALVFMGILPVMCRRAPPRLLIDRRMGSDSLAWDHRGARLLSDGDGKGRVEILRAPPGLRCFVDGREAEGRIHQVNSDFVAVADAEGEYLSLARLGEWPTSIVAAEESTSAEGCGWLLWTGRDLVIDGRSLEAMSPGEEVNVWAPFYLGFRSSVPVRWAPAGLVVSGHHRLSPAEPGALTARDRAWTVKNASAPRLLSGLDAGGVRREDWAMSHLGPFEWQIDVPGSVQLVRLAKTYDAFHGRQRARVLVNGRPAGWWHLPEQNRIQRWQTGSFLIPGVFFDGVSQALVTVEPPGGSPLWSVGEIVLTIFT
jgi:hypothetical protein